MPNPYHASDEEQTLTPPRVGPSLIDGDLTIRNVFKHVWRIMVQRPLDCLIVSGILIAICGMMSLVTYLADTPAFATILGYDEALLLLTIGLFLACSIAMAVSADFAANSVAGRPGPAGALQILRRWLRVCAANLIVEVLASVVFVISFVMAAGMALFIENATALNIADGATIFVLLTLPVVAGSTGWVVIRYLAVPWLIVRHGAGVRESLKLAPRYMVGRKWHAAVILIAFAAIGMWLTMLTLGLALLMLPAAGALTWGVICELVVTDRPEP